MFRFGSTTSCPSSLNIIGEPSTALFRKSDLEDQRPAFFNFDGAYGHGIIDMVMWTALLLKGDAVYLLEPQSAFRIHPGQRQHDPTLARRTIDSIRELQAVWLALGLHRRRLPHMLTTQPYPMQLDGDWIDQQVRWFKLRGP